MMPPAVFRRIALPALAMLAALPVLASSGGETPEVSAAPAEADGPIAIVVPATRQLLPEAILERMRANLEARADGVDFAPTPSRLMPGTPLAADGAR
jgi:hypothetical protein